MKNLLMPGLALALMVGLVACTAADESSIVKTKAEDGTI